MVLAEEVADPEWDNEGGDWGAPAADWSAESWGDVHDDWAQTEVLDNITVDLPPPVPKQQRQAQAATPKLPQAPQPFLNKGKQEAGEPIAQRRRPRVERSAREERPAPQNFPPLSASSQPPRKPWSADIRDDRYFFH